MQLKECHLVTVIHVQHATVTQHAIVKKQKTTIAWSTDKGYMEANPLSWQQAQDKREAYVA